MANGSLCTIFIEKKGHYTINPCLVCVRVCVSVLYQHKTSILNFLDIKCNVAS